MVLILDRFFYQVTSADFRNSTTVCDNHRCHDNPSGQHTNLAHDKLYNFMALIYELSYISNSKIYA